MSNPAIVRSRHQETYRIRAGEDRIRGGPRRVLPDLGDESECHLSELGGDLLLVIHGDPWRPASPVNRERAPRKLGYFFLRVTRISAIHATSATSPTIGGSGMVFFSVAVTLRGPISISREKNVLLDFPQESSRRPRSS